MSGHIIAPTVDCDRFTEVIERAIGKNAPPANAAQLAAHSAKQVNNEKHFNNMTTIGKQ
ncbi:MAG: hypothetical protein V4463_14490 [Pseudomonadota bacterium]